MHRDHSSGPTTPVKSQTRTRSHTQTITKQSPGKFLTRTTTTIHTTTVVIGNPPSSSQSRTSKTSSTHDDSDDPNEDATITFATDSDNDHTPTVVSATPPISPALSSRPSRSLPPASSLPPSSPAPSISAPSSRLERDTEDHITAYYEHRYPGKVPHPDTLIPSASRPTYYYVVTAGVQVGIFTDWNHTSSLVTGISGAAHQRQRRFHRAWLVYNQEYRARRVRILSEHQDTAPLHAQIQDNGLEDLSNHIVTLPSFDHLSQQMDTDTSNTDAERPTTSDTVQPLSSNTNAQPPESKTAHLPPEQPEVGDEETVLQNLILTQHQISGSSWANGNVGWGNDFERTEHGWADTIPSPRIVSLTTGRGWGEGYGESVFQWRTQASSGKPSHKHIVLYARHDLHRILQPLGERRDDGLSGVASDKWARTLIVRSLPEAQHAQVPGPNFTLAEVRERLAQVEADVSATKASVIGDLKRLSAIKAEQEPLRSALRALDNERTSLLDKNEEKERTLKDLAEVQADLKDLEALAMAFC
ncbi:hypothetical protein PQX77_011910 [Marasmius sp. AFHP31]|nr:hypothetical protein PQX77_011910 [Marasmius sp. AFHP31]